MKLTFSVFDGQQGKALNIAPKLALRLTTLYPYRFRLLVVTPYQLRQEIAKMSPFKMPDEVKALANGTHILTVIETRTVVSQRFNNEQEELTCLEESTQEVTRVWISHTRKAVDEALNCGIMRTTVDGENVEVVIGAQFTVVIANGKKVALLAHTPAQPVPATPKQ